MDHEVKKIEIQDFFLPGNSTKSSKNNLFDTNSSHLF